jgi:ribosomal-protein-alanine N-acetyltransferase
VEGTILITPRCIIRPVDQRDSAGIFEIRSDERMSRYVDRILMETLEEAEAFIEKIREGCAQQSWHYWVMLSNDYEERFLGVVCLWNFSSQGQHAEIGYELLPRFQGQGLMVEVVSAMVQYSFDVLNLQKITAVSHADNTKSLRVLESAGFHFVQSLPLSMVEYAIEK